MSDKQTEGWSDLIRNLPRKPLPRASASVLQWENGSPNLKKTHEVLSKLDEQDLEHLLKEAGEVVFGDKAQNITALAVVIYHKSISQLE